MAIDDLDILRQELPEVFKNHIIPPDWEEDWFVIPIDDPESFPPEAENPPDFELAPGGGGTAPDPVVPSDAAFSPDEIKGTRAVSRGDREFGLSPNYCLQQNNTRRHPGRSLGLSTRSPLRVDYKQMVFNLLMRVTTVSVKTATILEKMKKNH
jgi:hypothetical protein